MKRITKNKTIGTIDKIPNSEPIVASFLFSPFLYKYLLQIKHNIAIQEQYIYGVFPNFIFLLTLIHKRICIITEHKKPIIPNTNVINE